MRHPLFIKTVCFSRFKCEKYYLRPPNKVSQRITRNGSNVHIDYRRTAVGQKAFSSGSNSTASVIKTFLQYFSIEDTHFMNELFIKISRTCVKSQADPGLEL